MKESKPYPRIDEEDGSSLSAQESVALAYDDSESVEIDFSKISSIPQTWDELLECLKEGEEEIQRGEYIPGEVVFRSMRERIDSYAS